MPSRRPSSRRRSASEPSPGSLADLQAEADPHAAARGIALRRLTAAPRTAADLRADLLARGVETHVADDVVGRFTEVGLVDDAAYAAMWVNSRSRTRGSARGRLRQELRGKGIAEAVIEEALTAVDDAGEWERGRALVEGRLRTMTGLAPEARNRRLTALLMRRGYPGAVAQRIVRSVLSDDGGLHLDNVQIAD